jgi:DNA-binding winged helix-turn-helix (wHTH) protein/tetratricopeptide (TPR) repeat protein
MTRLWEIRARLRLQKGACVRGMNAVFPRRLYRFGLFEADAESGKLLRQGVRIKLQDQPFRVLCILLDRAGEVVSREELRQALWPADTYVEFEGSLNAALRRLRYALGDSADNPVFIETLPKRGYRFLAPVAVKESTRDTSELAETPAGTQIAARDQPAESESVPLPHPEEDRNWRRMVGVSLACIVLALLVVASYRRLTTAGERYRTQVAQPRSVTSRRSVAVLGFTNTAGRGEDAWLSTALSEMLSTELATGDKLRLVSGEDVAQLRLLSPWAQTGTLGQESSSRIGASLSSDLLLLGSYTSVGKPTRRQLRLDVRLQDARTGNILAEIAEIGSEEDLFRLTSQVGGKLRQRLGVAKAAETEEAEAMASTPANSQAARLYALGLDKLRQFDALPAKDLFEQAIKADARFPLSHLMLARAWNQLGYEQRRKEEAERALDLSTSLPRTDRMLVEGDYYESLAQHEKAASTYRALFALFPDSVEYGLQLAAAQAAAGHENQAVETIAQLRRLPLPASADPRIDLAEVWAMPTNTPAALVLVRNALAKAAAPDKKLVYAQARTWECITLIYGDNPEQGKVSCEDASKIFLAAGNRLGAADALRLIGDSQGAQGHYEPAIATYQRALAILQELGEEHAKTGAILNNMAGAYINMGHLDRAEQLYRKAKYHFEQAGNKGNMATALGNIADVLYLRGKLPDAAKLYQQTMESEALLDPSAPGYAMYRLADLELAQGQPKKAQDLAAQAVDAMRPSHGGYQYLTGAMVVLGDALMAQGDLAGARQQYQQTLETRQKLGEQDLVAESQVSLAELSLEEGHPEQAELLLRPAIAGFEKEKEIPDATGAYTLLSRALQMRGNMDDARKAIQHARDLSRTSPDPALKLPAAIQHARVAMTAAGADAAGRAAIAAARQQLRSVIATAKKLGYYQIECEARLAMGEVTMRTNPADARSQLTELADEAHGHGFELVARKAANLQSQHPPRAILARGNT